MQIVSPAHNDTKTQQSNKRKMSRKQVFEQNIFRRFLQTSEKFFVFRFLIAFASDQILISTAYYHGLYNLSFHGSDVKSKISFRFQNSPLHNLTPIVTSHILVSLSQDLFSNLKRTHSYSTKPSNRIVKNS